MVEQDTQMGGEDSRFPLTQRSAVSATRSDDPQVRARAVEALISCYWRPVYKFLRIRRGMPNEDAKDLTQSFFAHVLESGVFERYEPGKAAFRTFLRVCLEAYASNEFKARGRQKRGGGRLIVSLDFDAAETELGGLGESRDVDVDEYFRREWIRSLLGEAVEALKGRCAAAGKSGHFQLFERYDLHDEGDGPRPTYDQLAAALALPATQVTNHLAWARREFRGIVLGTLKEMTGSDTEFREEARALLGIDPA